MKTFLVKDENGNEYGSYTSMSTAIDRKIEVYSEHSDEIFLYVEEVTDDSAEKALLKKMPTKVRRSLKAMKKSYKDNPNARGITHRISAYTNALADVEIITEKEANMLYLYLVDY